MIGLRRLTATLVLGWVLVGCGSANTAAGPPTPLPQQPPCHAALEQRPLCVLILGDSIAAGSPLTGDDRWWVRLASGLGSALPDHRVVVDSWAVPGSHVDVLESAARDQPALGSYDVAIVIEGVNDQTSLPIDAWRVRYEAAIAAIEGRGLIVVVGTPPPTLRRRRVHDPLRPDRRGASRRRRRPPPAPRYRGALARRWGHCCGDLLLRPRTSGRCRSVADGGDGARRGTRGDRQPVTRSDSRR